MKKIIILLIILLLTISQSTSFKLGWTNGYRDAYGNDYVYVPFPPFPPFGMDNYRGGYRLGWLAAYSNMGF